MHVETAQAAAVADNALDLIERYDIVCDGTDNFATRFLVSDACVLAKRTLVSAAVLRFEGQLSVFKPHEGGPCYRCLYPEAPPPGVVPTCSEAGVLGAVTGVMGTLQATETLKEILGIGETPVGPAAGVGRAGDPVPHGETAARSEVRACGPDATCKICPSTPTRPAPPVPSEPLGVLLLSGSARPRALRFRPRLRRRRAGPLGRAVRHQPRLSGTVRGTGPVWPTPAATRVIQAARRRRPG